jgi:two-component system phosphate regulon sensor histidine kinase PhoR
VLVFPIGRLLLKTRDVLGESGAVGSGAGGASGEELLKEESFGEWSELESSIDEIRRDLIAKAESLSVEREELATLMGAISDAILAVDNEGKPLFFNSRFALLYGNQEALRERSVRLWEMFRVPEILEAFKKALTLGHNREVKAVSLEREGESKRFYAVSVSPLRKQDGDIYGAVGIFHDVTDLKGAEQIRIDFVANVSHELRTPLTSIKGYTDTLLIDVADGKPVTKDFLDIIARNVDRLMTLIRDLLDLSSLESTDVLHKAPINTAEATSRIVRQLHGGMLAKKQKIIEQINAPVVLADSRRLDQVLTNLLENANKYTPPGGEIRVRWDNDRDGVLLRVSDNGPGIPPEHHARLFERFYRVDKARSRDQGGTGLGLAIVKHIMQRHDGVVWIESHSGQGSTFACRFPG